MVNLLLLLLLGMLWGTSYLFIKVLVGEVPVVVVVAGRLTLSAVVMWVLLLVLRQPIPRERRRWQGFAVMGFLNGFVPYLLIASGEQYISSGLAALLQATMPIFTVILAHFFVSEERMSRWSVVGVAIGFVGVLVLMLPELRQGMQASVLGQLAIVGSSLSYGAAAVFARKRQQGQAPLALTTGQLTMGAVYTLPLALILTRPADLSPSLQAMGSLLGLSVLGTVIAYVIYYVLIERSGATFTSTVTYIIPVFGLVLGALVLGELLTPTILLGLVLILLGVLLVRR